MDGRRAVADGMSATAPGYTRHKLLAVLIPFLQRSL